MPTSNPSGCFLNTRKHICYYLDGSFMEINSHLLNNMNLSASSNAMKSVVSWCRIITSEDENLSTSYHKHTVHELHYVYTGELQFQFDNLVQVCGSGEYIFIPAGIMHSIEHTAPFTQKLVLGFDISTENEVINETFSQTQKTIVHTETDTFHALAQALLHKFSASEMTTSVSISLIVHTLLLEVVDHIAKNSTAKTRHLQESEDAHRIDQMLSFINENVFNSISIGDVAAAMNLSTRQASRICQRLFACSINQLIIQSRLKQICNLLTDTKLSIAEISEIAGFANPYSFSRHFLHYTGVTPSSYRKDYEMHR